MVSDFSKAPVSLQDQHRCHSQRGEKAWGRGGREVGVGHVTFEVPLGGCQVASWIPGLGARGPV